MSPVSRSRTSISTLVKATSAGAFGSALIWSWSARRPAQPATQNTASMLAERSLRVDLSRAFQVGI
jgi:hypothetical protein